MEIYGYYIDDAEKLNKLIKDAMDKPNQEFSKKVWKDIRAAMCNGAFSNFVQKEYYYPSREVLSYLKDIKADIRDEILIDTPDRIIISYPRKEVFIYCVCETEIINDSNECPKELNAEIISFRYNEFFEFVLNPKNEKEKVWHVRPKCKGITIKTCALSNYHNLLNRTADVDDCVAQDCTRNHDYTEFRKSQICVITGTGIDKLEILLTLVIDITKDNGAKKYFKGINDYKTKIEQEKMAAKNFIERLLS